jgi:peptidoglycan L-alanyl-D-glutamate endopeptidase CwlK
MFKYGNRSTRTLKTCHKDIQTIMNEVIKIYNVSILEGERSKERQQKLYADGKSKLDGVNKKSKHQSSPSMAVDCAPYPIRWQGEKSMERFYYMMGIIEGVAYRLLKKGKISHMIRKGIDWNCDGSLLNNSWSDCPHFELITVEEYNRKYKK